MYRYVFSLPNTENYTISGEAVIVQKNGTNRIYAAFSIYKLYMCYYTYKKDIERKWLMRLWGREAGYPGRR